MNIHIRPASAADADVIVTLVKALAAYEREPDAVKMTPAMAARAIERGHARAVLAEFDGETVGLALYFFNFSTWEGRRGLYLEDLFVKPEARGRGAGLAMFRHLARIAIDEDCARMEWSVLDWNEPAITFYRQLGAEAMDEWTVHRLAGEALRLLARPG